jgi:hypothetical protein
MRTKLLQLLRTLEQEDAFRVEYTEYTEGFECEYAIVEFIEFPNFRLVINKITEKEKIPDNSIKAELKRMEADGLVMIGTQQGLKTAEPHGNAPQYDSFDFTCESVVLTTRGKSNWHYFLHQVKENPLSTILSIVAIIISIFAFFL